MYIFIDTSGSTRHFPQGRTEQKYEEMIDVLSHLNQYVPTVSTESTVNVTGIEEPVRMTNDYFHTIALGMCICVANEQ